MALFYTPIVDEQLVVDKGYALLTAAGAIMDGRACEVLRGVKYTVVNYASGADADAARKRRVPVSWTPKANCGGGRLVRVFIGQIPMGYVWDIPALMESLLGCPIVSFLQIPNPKAPYAPSTACIVMVRQADAAAFASLNHRVLMTAEGAALVSLTDKARFKQQLKERDVRLEAFIQTCFPELLKGGRVRKAGQPLAVDVRGEHVYRWNPYSGSEAKTFLTAATVRS